MNTIPTTSTLASLDRYGRIALYKQKHHLIGGGFDNFVTVECLEPLSITNTLPYTERIGAMSIIHSHAKNFNSSSLTLREALNQSRHVIHREPGAGCIFVEDSTPVNNGYTVFFNDNPNSPIKYRESIVKGVQLPLIDSSDDGDFYRDFAQLEYYLQPHSNQPGWECVPVKREEVRA